MARRAWSKLETGGGGGRRNWPAKNDPYKYAAAIETGPRLPKRFDSLHLRFRSRDSKFKRREDVSTIIPSFRKFINFSSRSKGRHESKDLIFRNFSLLNKDMN